MSWTPHVDRSTGYLVTAADWNNVGQDLNYIINSAGNLQVTANGPHSIGGDTPAPHVFLLVAGPFTPSGASPFGGVYVAPRVSLLANQDAHGLVVTPTFIEAGSGTHDTLAGATIITPSITNGAASVSNAYTLYIVGVPGVVGGAPYTAGIAFDAFGNDGVHIGLGDSVDVAHGMTSVVPGHVYGFLNKAAANAGGMCIRGLTEDVIGLDLKGNGTNEDTTSTSAAQGAVNVNAAKKSGAALTTYGNTANIFCVRNEGGGARWIVKGNGDVYRDGTDNTYFAAPSGERYDDPLLALAWEHAMNPHPGIAELQREHGRYTRQDLIDAGLLGELDQATGRHFYNESALVRLSAGAIWTCALEIRELKQRLATLEEHHA